MSEGETNPNAGQEETQEPAKNNDSDFISKKVYNDLQGNYDNLNVAHQKMTGEIGTLKEQLGKFEGFDLDLHKEMLEERKKAKIKGSKGSPEEIQEMLDSQKAELTETYTKHNTKIEAQRDEALKELHMIKTVGKAMESCPKLAEGADKRVREHMAKFIQQDPESPLNTLILNESGEVRMSPNNPMKSMSLEEYWAELEITDSYWFAPKGINKGSKTTGETFEVSKGGAKVNLEKFRDDPEYRKQFPQEVRAQLYPKVGL